MITEIDREVARSKVIVMGVDEAIPQGRPNIYKLKLYFEKQRNLS